MRAIISSSFIIESMRSDVMFWSTITGFSPVERHISGLMSRNKALASLFHTHHKFFDMISRGFRRKGRSAITVASCQIGELV